jgi:hypothetical protein
VLGLGALIVGGDALDAGPGDVAVVDVRTPLTVVYVRVDYRVFNIIGLQGTQHLAKEEASVC